MKKFQNIQKVERLAKFFSRMMIISIGAGFGLTFVGGYMGAPHAYLLGILLVIAAIPFTGAFIGTRVIVKQRKKEEAELQAETETSTESSAASEDETSTPDTTSS